MERYNSTPNTIDTEKHYLTTKYPEISRTDTDIYIFVHKGTRLTDLSNLYYGTVTNWFILALANNLGKGSICVPNHMQFRIPMSIMQFENDLNSINTLNR